MKKNASFRLASLALLLPLISGCGARVKSFPYDESVNANVGHGWFTSKEYKKLAAEGFVYSLPKTVIEISGKCTLYRQFFYKGELGSDKIAKVLFTANLDNGVTVSPKGQVDPTMRFRIDPKALRNWRVNTGKVNFVLSDAGIMTKMNSILEDKTAEIIESTAKTGINVAKTMALAGADEHVTHGLIENVGTFDVVGRVDPDELTCGVKKEIFQDLLGRAQELAHASLIKDELRDKVGAKDTILVVNQIWINYDPKENKKNSSNEIRANVAKSNFITGVTRAITLENFGKNYVNGIVTRIPAFAEVTISATPQIRNGEELPVNLKDFVKARIDVIKNDVPKEEVSIANANTNLTVDKQTCQTQKVQVEAAHKLQIAKNKNDKEHCRKLEASYKVKMDNFKKREDNFEKRATAIVQQAQSVQLAKAEQGILEKGKDEMTEENTVIYKALVPISQLGRIGVIPVHSNTFVKQTKNVDINVDTGRVASYDFEASSSGEKAALMLEHISESVVKDVPEIIKGLSAGKSTK